MMSSITLDQATAEKLRECRRNTALRDANGKIIGFFEPPELHIYEKGEVPEFVQDQLQRPLSAEEKLTTAEVKRLLRELP